MKHKVKFTASLLLAALLTGCGSGGGGNSATLNDTPNAAVAAQVADIKPTNAQETVSVFVALDSSNSAASGVVSGAGSNAESSDAQRLQSQKNFLAALQSNAAGALSGASTDTCSTSDLSTRISQAHTPNSGNAVRIDLTACELDLLTKLKGVNAVYPDIPMSTQSQSSTTLSKTIAATKMSFNGVTAQPTLGTQTLDGAGQVIAVLDTGVEDRHPALAVTVPGGNKVLPGACFSTASNGGKSFCPNKQSVDTTSATAARSCVETWTGTRAQAIQAGCAHGTGMASAASMRYTSSDNVAIKGVAPGAQILPVQVFNQSSTSSGQALSASAGDLLAGIEWVTAQAQKRRAAGQAPIVAMNMSLGGGSYSAACDSDYVGGLFKTAFANLRNQGVLPLVATGNSGTKNAISFPACVSNAVSVSAAKPNYAGLASYANFSSQAKVVAIGGDVDGSGRYALPVLCTTSGSYDCWQEVAGTSPATALVSGGVAALYSAKTGATLADVESALTTDIAATSATNSTALHLIVNDGNQNITRPALRLTASAYKLLGQSEPATASTPTPTPAPTPMSDTPMSLAQICIFSKPNYTGSKACAVQVYGTIPRVYSDLGSSNDLFYRFSGKVGSIQMTDLITTQNLVGDKATVTLYTSLRSSSSGSGSVNASSADTSTLTGTSNPTIRMIRIQTTTTMATN
ncbi:S8 family serine peptidase [Limnohabitans sp.]|uniref:S8 family peptidase n=1 Tax=Limnohabitans sp. TaxID=1907725 RepID=UPI00286EED41|nr:S8 family serine peptidase [Limnohabitans sp.]